MRIRKCARLFRRYAPPPATQCTRRLGLWPSALSRSLPRRLSSTFWILLTSAQRMTPEIYTSRLISWDYPVSFLSGFSASVSSAKASYYSLHSYSTQKPPRIPSYARRAVTCFVDVVSFHLCKGSTASAKSRNGPGDTDRLAWEAQSIRLEVPTPRDQRLCHLMSTFRNSLSPFVTCSPFVSTWPLSLPVTLTFMVSWFAGLKSSPLSFLCTVSRNTSLRPLASHVAFLSQGC